MSRRIANATVLLDVDNTLTPPREPLTPEMMNTLRSLRVPFHVAAGSHMTILRPQFFDPLLAFGFAGCFDAFVSNGAVHYRCDYTASPARIDEISAFNIRDHLGESDYASLMRELNEVLEDPSFEIPHDCKIGSERVVYRVSMINLCPMGRMPGSSDQYRVVRERFGLFDHRTGYRASMLTYLKRRLEYFTQKYQLSITLGGQTSFDIGVEGQDKTNAIRYLISRGFERVVFIGDALFEGGNDASIAAFVGRWPATSECPVTAIQTESWRHTIHILVEQGFVF